MKNKGNSKFSKRGVILLVGILIIVIYGYILIGKEFSVSTKGTFSDETDTSSYNLGYTQKSKQKDQKSKKNKEEDNWKLLLVNSKNPIPSGYEPSLVTIERGYLFDERASDSLKKMLADARACGLDPIICSSYRTTEKQASLFQKEVQTHLNQGYSKTESEQMASKWIARPGTSEHQTGLAVDIVARSYQKLDENQETTAEQQWLHNNCYKYGFILRFLAGKSDITGVEYESWHYRYVGEEAAAEIMSKGICLEEYLDY